MPRRSDRGSTERGQRSTASNGRKGSTTTKRPPESPAPRAESGRTRLDRQGRYFAWGRISWAVVGIYGFILIVVVVILGRPGSGIAWWAPWVIGLFVAASLSRYLSTHYRVDDAFLYARRFLGGVRVRLDEVRRIEYVSLRELAPTAGVFGAWGWRGRMWSPIIGRFDSIHTDPVHGLLVSAGDFPLYLSPRDPVAFARELSRRVRSYTGRLAVDVGDPLGPSTSQTA